MASALKLLWIWIDLVLKQLWTCPETTLKQLWHRSEFALQLLWIWTAELIGVDCWEQFGYGLKTALKVLWKCTG